MKLQDYIKPWEYRKLHAYLRENSAKFRIYCEGIKPDLKDPVAVKLRIAFAILSANTPFDASVKALDFVKRHDFQVTGEDLAPFQCVPAKAEYIRILRDRPFRSFLRKEDESWHEYRERLCRSTEGLGRCKASFAACLLYPTEADLAVIDTHICTTYLHADKFVGLGVKDYQEIERDICRLGKEYGLNGFAAHWAIWTHSSGIDHNHAIFPGSHK